MLKLSTALPVRKRGMKYSLAVAALACCPLTFLQSTSVAQNTTPAESQFYKGYYLQHEQKDLKKAIKAYETALSLNAAPETRKAIDSEMSVIQEDLSTADFAQVMPENAFAYVEISNPAHHVEQLAKLMGLTGRDFDDDHERVVIPIEDGFAISSDFQISPALLREMKKIRGAAVAITDIGRNGKPSGLAVIHPGDSDLVKGLVETGIQFVPSNDEIGGFPTFQIENEIWLVKTERLVLASTERSKIKDCLARILDQSKPSLQDHKRFQLAREAQSDPAVFAFVEPSRLMPILSAAAPPQELAIARLVLDIDHTNYASLAIGSTSSGLQTQFQVDFDENHNSLGYGLIRTVPLSRKALSHVPSGCVGVVGMGLNPKMLMAAEMAGGKHLTALDIGRELFANIEELGLFVMPTSRGEVPDFGLIIAASDINKSEKLWETILSLPTQMGMEDGPKSDVIEVAGIKARVYDFRVDPNFPPIVIARLNDDSLIAGTQSAVETAIVSSKNGQTLANDPKAKALWSSTTEHTAKAIFVHAGRALKMAANMEGGRDAMEMRAVSQVINDLTVTLVLNEAPTRFSANMNLNGLPLFEDVVKTVAGMKQGQRSYSDRAITRAARTERVEPAYERDTEEAIQQD